MYVSSTYQDSPACPRRAGSSLIRYSRSEPRFPVSDGLMGEGKAARSTHLSNVTQAQFVAQPPQDREQDTVRRTFQRVARRASSLVEDTATVRAEE
jgi:hypothetical protein